MKNLPLLYCGILFLIVASWCGLILGANVQFGNLQPGASSADDTDGPVNPKPAPGIAEQGRQVYIQMGCVYCHTQQPRPASAEVELLQTPKDKKGPPQLAFLSPDIARNWAKRGTVPRDYIYQDHPLLGFVRNGPDLANYGDRTPMLPDNNYFVHLYDPRLTAPGSIMPPFRFLFKMQKIGDEPSPLAINLPDKESIRPAPGYELVPTDRAIALAAYLRSLSIDYTLPEATFVAEAPAPAAAPAAPAAPASAPAHP